MADSDKNDPPDEFPEDYNPGGRILEISDNNHYDDGQEDEFQEMEDGNINGSQVNNAGIVEEHPPEQESMDTGEDAEEGESSGVYPGDGAQHQAEEMGGDSNVDDIERTLEILDQTDDDRNETVDEIEHTLEMMESDNPTGLETNQIDTGHNTGVDEVFNEDGNAGDENVTENVQMSFEEQETGKPSQNEEEEDDVDEVNPIQDTIEIDDNDEENQDDSRHDDNVGNQEEEQEEQNEGQEEQEDANDENEDADETGAAQDLDDNEEDNSKSQTIQDDLEDNQDSGENAHDSNNADDNEPMEIHDDEEDDSVTEVTSDDKKHDESSEHNDVEAHTEDVEHVQEPEESDVCLIPDDEENEVTDAEREKARQVREDADKEDEEAEQVKKDDGNADTTTTTDNIDNQEPDESLQQDANVSTEDPAPSTEGTESSERIIISPTVTRESTCIQCNVTKNCSYRYKHSESGEYRYLCQLDCAQTLQNGSNNKFFIRNKKFLLEELDSCEGENPCVQCKESKKSKFFFKVDDEYYYICNNDCYNLLNMEEPDKYKLKRNSIRVRNIGATLNHATSKSTDEPVSAESSSRIVARTEVEAENARIERNESFVRRCIECDQKIQLNTKVNLNWETFDFCNEICLGKYQREIGANCKTCDEEVPHQSMGKYCVRFGFEIRQFCKASCLNEFKKGLKTCSCCQKDISQNGEGFLAPVGDKDQFKDFCSQACMRKYDCMCNPKKKLRVDKCAVCNIEKPIKVEMILDGKEHQFCTNPCFSAFKFVSNINADQCNMCSKYFERKNSEKYTIYTDNKRPKVFCCKICINVYIIVNRKIVSCQWCKVKKYNFDMIYRTINNQEVLMCSLNCLTLHTVSASAVNRSVTKCDNCNATATPQYHLTMSDSSMRNFCKYQCVMKFQNQFGRTPLTLDNNEHKQQLAQESLHSTKQGATQKPFPTGLPKKVKPKTAQKPEAKPPVRPVGRPPSKQPIVKAKLPVISKVASLASFDDDMDKPLVTRNKQAKLGKGAPKKAISSPMASISPKKAVSAPLSSVISQAPSTRYSKSRSAAVISPSPSPTPLPTPSTSKKKGVSTSVGTDTASSVKTKIVTVPPIPVIVRNVQTMCKPSTKSVAIDNTVETLDAQNQTEKDFSSKCLLPVPVPIYLPTPMHMYATPFPVPIPIPIPIPVPIFIPTTRNSAAGIMKEISKIQDKMPSDPFEAELLMMAEMVADDKRQEESESDTEDTKPVLPSYSNTVNNSLDTNNFGDDVLQMALKMATSDYDDHPNSSVDLESAMHPSTISNPPPSMIAHNEVGNDQMIMLENNRGQQRGKKRPPINTQISPQQQQQQIRTPIRAPAKRMRRDPSPEHQQPPPQQVIQQPMEKPDANMCLKYTFGVNAWKQWVVTKNADMEKSSVRRRPFKTELLQMTADELNYSLCLFVKEVRKPNGTEYAPDTIYYLVLGIQQYLYENGRIDNIFTDPYYERFTDCLDEVSKKFSILYNDSQYIVTRVEEEHLWECKQLGAHSPHVLLSTLMFFNTKHFNLTTVEEHMQLSFSHIMKHWKRTPQNVKSPGARNVLLRFYPPQTGLDANPRKKKVYEQQENEENPLRCPVRLYEFYLSKCPESVKTRNDVFYLQPERSCVPDSPVWYSTQALSQESLQKMLHRVKMVKEINIALLTS